MAPGECCTIQQLSISIPQNFVWVNRSKESICLNLKDPHDADVLAYAYSNILMALLERQRTGTGRQIEISMLDLRVEWMGYPLYYAIVGQAPPTRAGAADATIFPSGPYATADGNSVLIAVQIDREWQLFCTAVLCNEELASAVGYATNSQRHAAREQLQSLIAATVATLSAGELTVRLESGGMAFSRARTLDDVWAHPQLQARGRFTQVDTPVGPMRAQLPPGADAHEVCMNSVPPLGEHTAAILAWLDAGSSPTTARRRSDSR